MEASSKIEESSEIRNYYRDTTNIIKEKFYPHFNLYHVLFFFYFNDHIIYLKLNKLIKNKQ